MKRFLAALIAICYLCLSTGFTLHTHYCMGERIEASLIENNSEHTCSHCGMLEKDSKEGCCHDEVKTVSAKVEAKLVSSGFQSPPVFMALVPLPFFSMGEGEPAFSLVQLRTVGQPHGPPVATALRLHVRNCEFLI